MSGWWLLLAGCVSLDVVPPAGFAAFADADPFRAVSPEGVTLRVRTVQNRPAQTQGFWVRALHVQLEREGYRELRSATFTSPAGPGDLIEWLAPVAGEQYIYMTAVVVTTQQILIAEAAGPFALYERYREAIVESLSSISWR